MGHRWWPTALAGVVLVCSSCANDSPRATDEGRITRDRVALVMVVESHETIAPELALLFEANRDSALDLLSAVLGVQRSRLVGLTLAEIEDEYAEEWMIQQLRLTAQDRYAEIVSLTDDEATAHLCVARADELARTGHLVDLLFVLHGNSNGVWFADELRDIRLLTADFETRGIPVRALYQTCCYGGDMIDDWEGIGISAVNGSRGTNWVAMLAPVAFLQRWTGGAPFDEAVHGAMQDEIRAVRLYEQQLGLEGALLSPEQIAESEPLVGGDLPQLLWLDFSASLAGTTRPLVSP